MTETLQIALYVAAFIIIAVASSRIAKLFPKAKLPLITGFLFTGIIAGPYVFKMVPKEAISDLSFLKDLCLAFIAFAAGSELYIKDLKDRFKSIITNSIAQLVVVFGLGTITIYFLSGMIPFMADMSVPAKMGVSMLIGTIFIASAPSSAIAVINELRAKGPFTSMVMGVIVVKDVLVIILFTVCFSVSVMLIDNVGFDFLKIVILVGELAAALLFGFLLYKLLVLVFRHISYPYIKPTLLILLGYSVYFLSHLLQDYTATNFEYAIHIEPLLVCILAGFFLVNYSNHRSEFHELLKDVGPYIYIVFFTLIGISMHIDLLGEVWLIALILFAARMVFLFISGLIGGAIAKDPLSFNSASWMGFVAQAGVAIALATVVENAFPEWGYKFETVIIAVVVLNEIAGPALFNFAVHRVKENHEKAKTHTYDGALNAMIFGFETQSVALARQLKDHGWDVTIASRRADEKMVKSDDIEVEFIPDHSFETLEKIKTGTAEAIVLLNSDEDNYKVCELAYEHYGTNVIVRLQDRSNYEKFKELGAIVMEPESAVVSLLDHLVRSPGATSLILGINEGQDAIDIEVVDHTVHGRLLRDLRLPTDVIILSISRKGETIITHGYTRLRIGDVLTVAGSEKSLDKLKIKLGMD